MIPVLDDEPYLPQLLKRMKDYKVSLRGELGLSTAVFNGIQKSSANIIVVIDGDGSHPPETIPNMIKLLNDKTWLVVGSRYCKNGYSQDSIIRKIISHFYCVIARLALRTKIRDSMSGFWVGYRWAFKFKPSKNYKFGLQLIKRHGDKHIIEFPIRFQKRQLGKSKVNPIMAITELLRVVITSHIYVPQ